MKNSNISVRNFVVTLLIGFVSGAFGGFMILNSYTSFDPASNRIIEEKTTTILEESALIDSRAEVAPAVVSILGTQASARLNNNSLLRDFMGLNEGFNNEKVAEVTVSAGTGFIISKDGLVLTNKHVVENKNLKYKIVMGDGREYLGEVLSLDPLNDLAIVQLKSSGNESMVNISNLPVAELGDSDALKIGQRVLAIGNALAEYDNTTTAGIISATGRDIQASDSLGRGMTNLTGLIQTDAAINPGNSGGPLVNLGGQVIGINTAIAANASGIGFAIPINDVKTAISSFKKYGKIIRPVLGVNYVILTPQRAQNYGLELEKGALLVEDQNTGSAIVFGSPASKADLKTGDVILEVDGKDIDVNYTLQKAIRGNLPGEKVKFKIWRNGEILDKEIVLEGVES
ncbi:hypothetical protein A2229_05365 [Candidatus Peregrinibacteria bacterium RIFOXYA2_FULL_33_7]|nr:MAG: hypothetical protein A2229_05365 [Candidatus Peregrinibacteria bacterium RIFOXYA2_FULL_33_7]